MSIWLWWNPSAKGPKTRHRTLLRLGEVTSLRESGQLQRIVAALERHLESERVDVGALAAEGGARGGGGSGGVGGMAAAGSRRLVRQGGRPARGRRCWRMRCSRWWLTGWWRRARNGGWSSGRRPMWSCQTAGRLRHLTSTTGPWTRSPPRKTKPKRICIRGCATSRTWTCGWCAMT